MAPLRRLQRNSRTTRVILAVMAATLASAAAISAYPGGGDTRAEESTLQVIATTAIVGDLVSTIGGAHVQVGILAGPGVDPHLYRPTEWDIGFLEHADLVVSNGLGLESRMSDALAAAEAEDVPMFAVAKDIPESRLLADPNRPGGVDPHIWFDTSLWRIAAATVAEQLSSIDHDHSADYESNLHSYQEQLDALEVFVGSQLNLVPTNGRTLLTAHEAFRYLGAAHDFDTLAAASDSTEFQPSESDIEHTVAQVRANGVKTIFLETSAPIAIVTMIQDASREQGFDLTVGGQLYSDTLGEPGSSEGTYLGMMRADAVIIVRGLT